jgi:hypothetical protein
MQYRINHHRLRYAFMIVDPDSRLCPQLVDHDIPFDRQSCIRMFH